MVKFMISLIIIMNIFYTNVFGVTKYDNKVCINSLVKSITEKGKIKNNYINIKKKNLNLNLSFPTLYAFKDKIVETKINTKLISDVDNFKDNIEKTWEDYREEVPCEGMTSYYVQTNNRFLLSITMDYYEFLGGAHGSTQRVPYNFNMKTGDDIPLSFYFKEADYKKKILDYINKEFKRNGTDKNLFKYPIDNFDEHNYYIKGGNLHIFFQQYEIAPYVAGIIDVEIPLNQVLGALPY